MDQDMTLDAAMSRAVRNWLGQTADELPDDPALFATIKAGLPPKRRAGWAPSFRTLSPRLVTAALGMTLAVALVGIAVMVPGGDGRAPSVGAAPSPSVSPFPMPPMPLYAGPLEPGRYAFVEDLLPILGRYEVSMDVPAGWQNNTGGWALDRGDGDPPGGATFEIESIGWIVVDPCGSEQVTVEVPPGSSLESVAGILSAWGSDTGARSASSPTTTEPVFRTFDGLPGVELTVLTPADANIHACLNGKYELWGDAAGTRWIQGAGESMRLRVIQVGSELVFLGAGSFPGTPDDVLAEQQAMLDSVRIVSRPAPSSAPGSPTPAASPETLPKISGDLTPGRYRVNSGWLALGNGYGASVELPEGWGVWNGTIVNTLDRNAALDLWAIDRVYSDPCAHDRFTDAGSWSSLDRFADSLTTWSHANTRTNPVVTEPRPGDFDGYPGFELPASIPTEMAVTDCADDRYQLWRYIDQDERQAEPGDELLVRVIAVVPASADTATPLGDGRGSGLLFVVATTRPGTRPEAREELLEMVDSVRITPPAIDPSPIPRASGGGG